MCEYGYLKGRRREAAIKQQLIVADRLAANSISSDTNSFDMKNAFASMSFNVLDKGLVSSFKIEDLHFIQQRYEYHLGPSRMLLSQINNVIQDIL